jgi:hypothetical protein
MIFFVDYFLELVHEHDFHVISTVFSNLQN